MDTALKLVRSGLENYTDDWRRTDAQAGQLCALLPHLRPGLRTQVATEAYESVAATWYFDGCRSLQAIAPYLNSAQPLALVERIKKSYSLVYTALKILLPYLAPDIVQNLVDWAWKGQYIGSDLSLPPYLALLDHFPAGKKRRLIQLALRWARKEDRNYLSYMSGAHRAALKRARLIPLVPVQDRLEFIRETITETIRRGHYYDVLEEIWSVVGDLDRLTRFALWDDVLRSAARRARSSLLEDIENSSEFIARLGGVAAVKEFTHAIIEVQTWFP